MKIKENIRILVVDDDRFVRLFLRKLLSSDTGITIAGEASNGQEAIEKVRLLKPDLVTMDINMPVMDGLEAIARIMQSDAVPILVITDQADAQCAFDAVSAGALEVLPKPDLGAFDSNEFQRKVRMLAQVKVVRHIGRLSTSTDSVPKSDAVLTRKPVKNASEMTYPNASSPLMERGLGREVNRQTIKNRSLSRIIAVAVSTGGPKTLHEIFSALPGPLPIPMLIAQHIAEGFDEGLVKWLSNNTPVSVKIGAHGERPLPGMIYLSPSQSHMTMAADHTLSMQKREQTDIFVPSCDKLLASVGMVFGPSAIGIVLTGMGDDGTKGIQQIKAAGGETIAQDEASSVIFGMPRMAIESGCIDRVMSIGDIAQWLRDLATEW